MNMSSLVASTLGVVSPKYRTLDQWATVYRQVIDGKPIEDKTKANRRCSLNHILRRLGGDRIISRVRPHEISGMVMGINKTNPQLAKRVLIETKDFFNEAVNYSWLDRSPAVPVKAPQVKVQRERLTFEQWCRIAAWAEANQPPWAPRMLMLALVTGQRRSDLRKMRFADVWDDHLHIEQEKTGARLALPLALRLDALGLTLGDVIDDCRAYAVNPDYLLRKHNGDPLVYASLSARFEEAREGVLAPTPHPPSLHECRSLSERMFREQGINTMVLLGHTTQKMTDLYNDDRGLSRGKWKSLVLN